MPNIIKRNLKMESCQHQVKKAPKTRIAAGREKSFLVDSCEKCGTYSWTEENQQEYRAWISELNKAEAFKPQDIRLSAHSAAVVERLKSKLLIDNTSAVIKGCLGFYLNILMNDEAKITLALEVVEKRARDYDGGKCSVRLTPSLYLKIEGMAKLANQSVKAFIEDVVALVLGSIDGTLPVQLTHEIQIAA